MPRPRVPTIYRQVRRDRAYFTITWSVMEGVDRHRINAAVPAMSGIWELYHLENSRVPRMLKMGAAWLGGLRHTLRLEADPGYAGNRDIRDLLESGDCYYRYTLCDNRADLTDVYVVLASLRNRDPGGIVASGRYTEVRIREPDEMLIHRVRTSSQEQLPPRPFGNEVPNMFDFLEEVNTMATERVDAALARERAAAEDETDRPDEGEQAEM
jgi:hypothetical protein